MYVPLFYSMVSCIQLINDTEVLPMKKTMIDFYNNNSFTHEYIFGVKLSGVVYMVKATADCLPYVLTLDKASRGAGYALKFKPNNAQRAMLLALGGVALCSVEYLESLTASSKYNRGEIFEKLVTEYYGQKWEKDNGICPRVGCRAGFLQHYASCMEMQPASRRVLQGPWNEGPAVHNRGDP